MKATCVFQRPRSLSLLFKQCARKRQLLRLSNRSVERKLAQKFGRDRYKLYISYNDILNFPYMKLMMLLGMKSAAAKAR